MASKKLPPVVVGESGADSTAHGAITRAADV
jgi:hypothetical protein